MEARAKRAAGRGFFSDLRICPNLAGGVSRTRSGGSLVGRDEPRPVVFGWTDDSRFRALGLAKKAGGTLTDFGFYRNTQGLARDEEIGIVHRVKEKDVLHPHPIPAGDGGE